MEKKINLKLSDYRDFFNEPHKKKPYYLFIEYGSKQFAFSNKKNADKWLVKFKKESTELYKELGGYLINFHEFQIKLISILEYSKFKNSLSSIQFATDRYFKVLNGVLIEDINIGREINNLYYLLENQFTLIKKVLQKNNRNQTLLFQIKVILKSLVRLRLQFDILLSDVTGVKKVISSDKIQYLNHLKIA